MRWKNHKKVHKLYWLSFICTFFIAIFLNTINSYADTPSTSGIKPLTDQQLMALISKVDKTNTVSTPPKKNGKDIYLQDSSGSTFTRNLIPATNTYQNIPNQRCSYNNQDYMVGDMVKIDSGWIKCTSSILFSSDTPSIPQQGLAVWIKIY